MEYVQGRHIDPLLTTVEADAVVDILVGGIVEFRTDGRCVRGPALRDPI
jgi:hypothetical protein